VATCTLQIGERVVLTSLDGAPEVEYVLFDPGEIELAATGPGMVQEVGYKTTAEDAIGRLADAGVTRELAQEAATAMLPAIAITYARGSWVRRIATLLGPGELFDGWHHDAKARVYEGRWLDLPALASESEIKSLTQLAQALHLVTVLHEVAPATEVTLSTREHMAGARPGGRSHKRYSLLEASGLPQALRAFAGQLRSMMPVDRSSGPTQSGLLEVLHERVSAATDPDIVDRLRALEAAMEIRERPLRGPLTDPQLWALDQQLSAGRAEGVDELLDALEVTKGKGPGTSYVRARAALISGREPPVLVAERAASLALSMPSFAELELLAAEAWNAAGDPKRSLPFARDLIQNAIVSDELRVRTSHAPRPVSPSRPPPPHEGRSAVDATPLVPAVAARSPQPFSAPGAASRPPAVPSPAPIRAPGVAPPLPSRASRSPRKETPAMGFDPPPESRRPTTSNPKIPQASVPILSRNPEAQAISGTWIGPPPAVARIEDDDARPAPRSPISVPPPSVRRPSAPPVRVTMSGMSAVDPSTVGRTPRVSTRPAGDAPRLANSTATDLMRGASQPPFRSDSPEAHVDIPKAPPVPYFGDQAEAAAALSLPEGLSGVPDSIETLPRSVLEARVQFTFLARELGREYDEKLGIILRADIGGIEAMQRVLLERYGKRAINTVDAAFDVRRHGAFLSEILARTFGAFWVDIGPSDVGYWAMVVPPSTRVWPFGRVLRLIAMQHNERDLVSYFLELQGRARPSP